MPSIQTPLGIAGVIVALALYLLPWLVAWRRQHHRRLAIAVVNILLGWTLLGWIVALVWACTAVRRVRPLPPLPPASLP